MSSTAPDRRMAGAALAALVALGAGLAWPVADVRADRRPNVIVVLTDDQRADTFGAMPWLAGELARSDSGWVTFPDAFTNTPLCCPARASLLTGRYARHTGVEDNDDGANLDESSTLATSLHEAGYRTGLIGKYLNRYPFGRLPYVPAGWDRFVAKRNQSGETVYRNFRAVEQGSQVFVREYATDWLADKAVGYVRTAPSGRPLFLLFAPSAPHPPWIPAERHEGTTGGLPVEEAPSVMGALRGAPPWVRALPEPSAAQRAQWQDDRRRADETLLAVDDALRAIVDALGDRLDETVIFVLSDNGYSFGEHRWGGKRCPYDECVRIPLAVHSPWAPTVAKRHPRVHRGPRSHDPRPRTCRPPGTDGWSELRAHDRVGGRDACRRATGSRLPRMGRRSADPRVDRRPNGRSQADQVRGRRRGALRHRWSHRSLRIRGRW